MKTLVTRILVAVTLLASLHGSSQAATKPLITILDCLGKTGHASDGRSLRPIIESGESGADWVAASEWPSTRVPGFMISDGRWKLPDGRSFEAPSPDALYDLKRDPEELNNFIGRNPDKAKHQAEAARMKGQLLDRLVRVESPQLESVRQRP